MLNFSGGPGALPQAVLEETQQAIISVPDLEMSILGVNHRSAWFNGLLEDTKFYLRHLLKIPDNYQILFMQGGSSLQFTMIPMNFNPPQLADPEYIVGGYWSEKAFLEAKKIYSQSLKIWCGKPHNYRQLTKLNDIFVTPGASYLHYVSNETVEGTQFHEDPNFHEDVTVICDMSSDFLSRPVDVSKYGMIYAHAQKNLGPAGVTVAIIRDDLLKRSPSNLPNTLSYKVQTEHNSVYNTPNVFGIYVLQRTLRWITKEFGSLDKLSVFNEAKARTLYDTIDQLSEHLITFADPACRSIMNATFAFKDSARNEKFLRNAAASGFSGLEGHRSIGGLRASMYNGMTQEGVQHLCDYLHAFCKQD